MATERYGGARKSSQPGWAGICTSTRLAMRKFVTPLLTLALAVRVESQQIAIPAAPHAVTGQRSVPAVQHDLSRALRDVAPTPPFPDPAARRERRRQLLPRRGGGRLRGAGRPLLSDTVVQDAPGAFSMPAPGTTFDGLDNVDGVLPPDPNGAVGPNHYVQWVNTS